MITSESIKNFPHLENSGPIFRKTRKGPESEFLNEFLQSSLPLVPTGQELTVFIEPKVDSVYPDAVAVYWDMNLTRRWSKNRLELSKQDIRVLHYLSLVKTADIKTLETIFVNKLINSLERLSETKLINQKKNNHWQIEPIKDIFAIKRLITIEAKISDWKGGLLQAFFHTWFASESYLLISKLPKNKKLVEEAAQLGIGITTHNQELDNSLCKARCENLPKSYASWMFNEWVWKTNINENF